MPVPAKRRFSFAKRAHALLAGAIIEAFALGLLILAIPALTGPDSILLLVLVVLLLQFPTSLALPFIYELLPNGASLGFTALIIYGASLFVGQTLVIAWWLNFKARKATWDPSAV